MFKFQWSEALVGASLAFACALMAIVQGGLTRMWMPKLGEVRGAQGELQGALSSVYSVTSILGPLLMTQLFGYFSRASAPVIFPGAAYACAAVLTVACAVVFYFTKR